ncbi:protein of unknown function [Methylocaldum szegediense]|uniref:Uncharacterized protein n=1 Tax=Methylocaldum szegediense TaxID=73780 RepID=A0ABM9I6S2_9GAMM|nr:protein of unknown function [Methylocaldum szegediense]
MFKFWYRHWVYEDWNWQTAYVERAANSLLHRLTCHVRVIRAFSEVLRMHETSLFPFLHRHNLLLIFLELPIDSTMIVPKT